MDNSFYSKEEIKEIGFAKVGENVMISKFARFYGVEKISIGNNVRIDDFCILSGNISLGNFIHISAFCALYGANGIELHDFSGLSPRTTVFSASDDFSGAYLIGPMISSDFRNVIGGKVQVGKFSQVGANCIILPNLIIGEGVSIGSMSLINKNLEPWGVYAGIPAKLIKERKRDVISLSVDFLSKFHGK